ncbi:MAG: hypothetical protein EBS07_12825, partial [Sphingobacteriia bacterium]|nr:hypothetical protein [Sphingobacteriia bacterium]
DNRNKTVTTWSKILLGGTGTNSVGVPDGTTFLGIKQAFPGISWGWYNQPGTFPYYISGTPLTQITDTQLETITDFAAEQWVNNLGNWSTNLDLLMPSLYISVTEKDLEKAHTKWSIKLCKKINQKFITKGVSPKPIVPFVSPITQTQASSTPYAKNVSQTYMPPQSILTNDQMKEWFLQQLVDENVDGIQIWQNMAYGAKTIIGRQLYSGSFVASGYTYPFCFEEQPIGYSGPAFAPCAGNPQNSWRKGPDGITPNPFSWRTLGRQAISAYSNYIKGVYMGITANFWWYNEISGSTLNTPPEWTPLNQNKVWGMTAGVTAGTETTGNKPIFS